MRRLESWGFLSLTECCVSLVLALALGSSCWRIDRTSEDSHPSACMLCRSNVFATLDSGWNRFTWDLWP
jgi:hypothetical protein